MESKISKLWTKPPSDFKLEQEKVLFKAKFTKIGKKLHDRLIIAYDNQLILYKKTDDAKPKGTLSLDFDTKFEIVRDQIAKETEEDDHLGEITGITLSREGHKQFYKLSCSVEQIKQWRTFLSQRINQLEFHHMFRVFKKIGKGNFASVYFAERIEDGLEVAVKAFSKQVAYTEENGKEAIVNEITLMRQLSQKNIMKLHEVYETSNSLYMCLELLEGGSLYDQMKSKIIMSHKQIQQIIFGILQGLKHMHSRDIMHRDLKLENLVFRKQNNLESIMIADFGLATRVSEKIYLYCRCGTPGYVAPEVINLKDMKTTYSSVCDIYSAGLVFHLLLTGKAAFSGKSYNTVVKLNREAKFDFKSKVFDVVPQLAQDLLKKMLEKDPKKRINAQLCLEHEYFDSMLPKDDYDYVEEGDEQTDLQTRMCKLNEDAAKFDMLRINQLQNSPIQSPALNPTKQMKHTVDVDPENFMHMRSPVITGRQMSIENSPTTELGRMDSPMKIQQPSRFKNNQNGGSPKSPNTQSRGSTGENALYKYALKKNSILQQQQTQVKQTDENHEKVKNIQNSLSQNI